jgi:hypothetical protein
VQPRQGAENTYIFESTVWELVVPPVLYLRNFVTIGVDLHNRVDGLLFADAFNDVSGLQIHHNGVAHARHLVR